MAGDQKIVLIVFLMMHAMCFQGYASPIECCRTAIAWLAGRLPMGSREHDLLNL